jgi:hypothetical protein
MLLQRRVIDIQGRVHTAEENAYLKLKARENALSDRVRTLSDSREELARDLNERTGADRDGIEGQIKQLDGQILQTRAELMDVSKEVAAAAPAQLAETVQTIYRGFDDGDMVGAGFIGASITFAMFIPLLVRTFRRRRQVNPGTTTQSSALGGERIDRMEAAIDSIAVEIERVSENQRFMTRLMTETQLAGTIAAVRDSTEAARMAAENASHG